IARIADSNCPSRRRELHKIPLWRRDAVRLRDLRSEIDWRVGKWPIFALHHSHGGCPILAFFARVGGDAAGATLARSTPPVVYAVVVPALFAYAKDGAPASVVASAV